MRITLLQQPIQWANPAANLEHYGQLVAALSGLTDLVVLPEMFTTGFCTDRPDLAEPMNGTTVQTLTQWASTHRIAITGSFMAREGDACFNRAFFITPDGQIHHADKRHLFGLAKEHNHFTPGKRKLLVEYLGVKILVLVCYDLRFPVWSRNTDNEYDLLIYVANFPSKRITDWDILLRARAIENQAYVVGLNCVGTDGLHLHYNGHSTLLDYNAHPLITFADDAAAAHTATIALDRLHTYRSKFAVWRDADRFSITL